MNSHQPLATSFIYLILFFLAEAGTAQTFQKTLGTQYTDWGSAVEYTSDGGYIAGGHSFFIPGNSNDLYLTKMDNYGNIAWTKTYGSTSNESCSVVKQTADGGYIMTGTVYTFATQDHDMLLVKTDSSGNLLWSERIGGSESEQGYSIQQTADGGYILCGSTSSFPAWPSRIYLVKTDSAGAIQWANSYGGTLGDVGYAVCQTPDGGFIAAGRTLSFGLGQNDIYVVRTDANGNLLWSKTYGDSDGDMASSMEPTPDGGYIIGGWRSQPSTLIFEDASLIKIDSAGNVQWSKTYGGIYQDYCEVVKPTMDGGFIFTGNSNSFGAINTDYLLVKTDSMGNLSWAKTYGGIYDHRATWISQTSDQGYIMCGYNLDSIGGDKDIYLIKTDSLGNSGCNDKVIFPWETSKVASGTIPATLVTPGGITTPLLLADSTMGTMNTICISVGTEDVLTTTGLLQVFPNPSTGVFTLSFNKNIMRGKIEIADALGRIIYRSTISGEQEKIIQLKETNTGIYFVKLFDGRSSSVIKLVISNN